MKWRAGLWAFVLLNACGGATPSPVSEMEPWLAPKRAPSTTDSSLLRFELSAEAGSGKSQAALRLSIENASKQWIKVRRHLTLERSDIFDPNVELEVTRIADGSVPTPACSRTHCGARRRAPEFIDLAPGDQFSQRIELSCDYALPDEGPWRILARYHDESDGPRVDENAEYWTWFNGTLHSNAVDITVRPFNEIWDAWHEELRQEQQDDEERRQQ